MHRRLTLAVHDLASAVIDRLVKEVPVYASLPAEEIRGDVARTVKRSIRTFAAALRDGTLPTPAELAGLREAAAVRAEEGVPLDAVVAAYHVGAQECVDHILASAEPADLPAVFVAQRLLMRYLQAVTSAIVVGYVQGHQSMLGERHDARQALMSALLDGGSAREAAERAGIPLPGRYLVLSIAVGPCPDERTPGVDRLVAARRKVRRLRVELERLTGGTMLSSLSVDGGLVLIPGDAPPGALSAEDRRRLSAMVEQAERICGADLVVGAVAADPGAVPQAARLAAEVRQVATVCGRGPGVYVLSDVLVEYQLTRPGPAREELAARLRPLADRPDLLGTLRAYLAWGRDRRRTAAALRVHPNTVDYRVRRIAALIGLDPGEDTDLPTIHAALMAHDAALASAGPNGPAPGSGQASGPGLTVGGDVQRRAEGR